MYMYWEGILVTVACGSGSGISTMEVFNPAQPYVSLACIGSDLTVHAGYGVIIRRNNTEYLCISLLQFLFNHIVPDARPVALLIHVGRIS